MSQSYKHTLMKQLNHMNKIAERTTRRIGKLEKDRDAALKQAQEIRKQIDRIDQFHKEAQA